MTLLRPPPSSDDAADGWVPDAPRPGLRERKKARTRRAISDVATRLFAERGFEAVTVAEVADAAEVSVTTVFNYFGSKEELFFDREEELRGNLVRAITDRPAGASVVEALAGLVVANRIPVPGEGWDAVRDPARLEGFRRFLATERASGALRARRLATTERLREDLAAALAVELDMAAGDAPVVAFAAMLAAAVAVRERALADAVLSDLDGDEVEATVRRTASEAFARVAAAFGDLDRPRAGAVPGTPTA